MGHRVAVVDDDESVQHLVSTVLQGRGWEVRTFGSCADAVAGLPAWSTELLIVDVNLPDGSGLELVDQVRNGAGRRVPAIVLSGLTTEQDIARGFAAGAVDFVGKPFRPGELLARCSAQLARQAAAPIEATRRVQRSNAMGLPMDHQGLVFGRFEVERELGRGGQGCVLLVHDRERGGEPVALKVLLPSDDEAARTRFIRETYSLSRIQHPTVAAIRDVGAYEGWLFYTMEVVPGPTLRSYTAGAPLTAPECRLLAHGLLHALEALERSSVIHRDLKPENVVLRDGDLAQPVLIDFGLARRAQDRSITRPDVIIGTAAYLPPEVIGGSDPTHVSDLFSAGLTLRFALMGEDVYPELAGMPLLEALLQQEIPLPAPLPADLKRVLQGLTRRSPADRFPTAAKARAALAHGAQPDDPVAPAAIG